MKKLCGCLEPCFVNGEAAWGHMGGILCLHASEIDVPGQSYTVGICGLDEQPVQAYINESQHECAKRCHKCINAGSKLCDSCKWNCHSSSETSLNNFEEESCFELL